MINNSLFKISEIPNFHPLIERYERLEWWKTHKRKCIEGEWVGGKWMPPELYYYINFHYIQFEEGIHRETGLPWLRDIDWEEALIYTEACGFSGFELDEEESCNRKLINPNREDIITFCTDRASGNIIEQYYNNFFKKDGTYKTYVPARDYLRRVHRGNLGKALYLNEAKHIIEFGSRGFGKDLEENTLLHSNSGLIPIKDIKIGDKIYGSDGKLTTVISKDYYTNQLQYEIKLKEVKDPVYSGSGHIWNVKTISGIFNIELSFFKHYIEYIKLPYKDSIEGPVKWSSVEYIKPYKILPSICIGVDNLDKLFLIGKEYVITHNSYSSSGRILHNFLFDGARDYDEYLDKKAKFTPLNSETVVGAIDTKFSNKLIAKVKTAYSRLPGSYLVDSGGELLKFPSPLQIDSEGSLAVGREYRSVNTGSLIQHVTFADNPFAANGGRPNRIFVDEAGFMNNLLETWAAIESTQTSAEFKRLVIYALGTGGLTSGGAVTFAQEIFYDPETYGCLSFKDIWENRTRPIGYFVSGVYALNKYKEGPNLITNEEKAIAAIEKEREEAKSSRSNTKILGTIINKPLKPSEIFLRAEGSFFPIHELKITLGELERNHILQRASYKADLVETKGGIDIVPSSKNPIVNYPLTKSDSMDACIEIFEKPKRDSNGKVFANRYILGADIIDDDGNSDIRRSLQSAFVLDTWTDRLVAEYTARTYLAEDYYENLRRLVLYYNGKLMYENNKTGLYAYFKNKDSLYLLAETPEILYSKELVKQSGIGNRSLGVRVGTDSVKLFGISLILKWLESKAVDTEDKKNIHLIRSQALLKEMISYSMDVNADRISALIVLFIYREDILKTIESYKTISVKSTTSDEFWGRAFKQFNQRKVYRQALDLKNN